MLEFTPFPGAKYLHDYSFVVDDINAAMENPQKFNDLIRHWCKTDLFFLLYFVLRVDVNHPWLVDRVTEVQYSNDHTLDLWPREHYKSTIITYGLNILEVLNNPEIRIGIFSHTRAIAKSFLHRIKTTFETNQVLISNFPDILWNNPSYEAPRWSLDDGIMVKRQGVYQEMTFEAWGLTDGMPTSKHFDILHYDDVVTKESVNTPAMIKKTDDCFRLSAKLGASDLLHGEEGKRRVIGTRYHFNDLYSVLEKNRNWITRKYPVQEKETGEYIFFSREQGDRKREEDGPYVWATQMMLDPREAGKNSFKLDWIKYYTRLPDILNLYLLVDPANEKKMQRTGSDWTVFWLWGLDAFGNFFWVDGLRERLNLTETWIALVKMCKKWPRIIRIGYEKYGMQRDLEYFKEKSHSDGIYLPHIEPLGGVMNKNDRIMRLVPHFENGKIRLPQELLTGDGRDLVHEFINEEYLFVPYAPHDDMMDAASRIEDVDMAAYRPFVPDEDGAKTDIIDLGWARRKRDSRFANG